MENVKKHMSTRIMAWILSLVMLFTMIPYGAFAEGEAEEGKLGLAPANVPVAVRDAAEPEDTSTSADAKNAVHGFVGVLVGGDINANLKEETGQRFKPIEGIRVYFQWYERTGNRTSPTYSAVSGADGQFHMGIKPYIGQDGKLVKFDADTTISAGFESYKMWVDQASIDKYNKDNGTNLQLQYSTGEGVEFTDRRVAGGQYSTAKNQLYDYRVLLMEKQDEKKMHKEATPTGSQIAKTGQGAVWGKVSWDYVSAGGVQWGIVSTPTSPAKGVTVTASYLSDYALKKIYSPETAKMLSLGSYKEIRGSGWTFKLETQLQDWIADQVAADKENWIAETVSAETNAEGDYLIQFKGTWGPNRNDYSVAEYERVAGKYYAGDAHRWTEVEANRLGKVADNATDGSFLTGALDWNEKHVNSDWLFISTKDTDDVVKRTPWNYNWYTGSDNGWGIHGGWAQAAFGVSTVQAANSTRADFNFAPAEIKFNITNFDTQANTAIPGDVAKTNTAGLPYKNTNDSFKIVWYDQDGNKVKEEPTQKPTSTGALAQATYDTTGVTETKTFIAKLHYVDSKGNLGQVLAQDAFTVKVGKIVVSAYDDVNIANPAANDESMKGAAYSAEGLPEGLTIDKDTGTVSGKAKVPGKYTVTVTTSIPDKDSGETMEGTSNYTALVTDSPLEHGEVGVEYNKTVKPAEVEGYVFKNVSSKFIDGKAIEGLAIENNQITGTPTKEVAATQEDPNVEVTYDIYKLNSKGEQVLIKKGHKDLVPLEITKAASQAPKYEPAYTDAEGTPGTEVTTEAPKFLDQKSTEATKPEVTKPSNVKFALGDGAPQGATIDPNTGAVTYTPTARDANTTVDIPVKVTYSDGTIDETLAKIKVGQAQADSYQPEYTEANGKAGTEATVNAPNFKDGGGQETTKPEGVEFTLGKDAPTGATVDKTTGEVKYKPSIDDAGTIVNIPIVVTYKDGSTDEVKAPIKVEQGDNLNYEPDYKSVVAQVKYPVTVEAPKFLDKDDKEANPQPTGMTFAIEDGFTTNGTLTIDPQTGAITYTAVDADKDTVIEVPVVVTYADGSKESVKAKIDVPSDADFYDPEAIPQTTEQGIVPKAEESVKITNNPPAGTTYTWQAVPKVNEAGETTGVVKVSYPDGTVDLVEVPVTVTASQSTKTSVDESGKKSVDPTDKKQGTGIIVTNPDKNTKVTAKDEDGNEIPAEINKETGEIEVTPGTNVDGPITVTIEDDDFKTGENPEGKKEIEVTVNGHTKNVDDNRVKTTVEETPATVNPTTDAQDTGLTIKNQDETTKTTVTAKDEDGTELIVTVDPETGKISVTPGTNVDGPITVTVKDDDFITEDNPTGEMTFEVPVQGHSKGVDDNTSGSVCLTEEGLKAQFEAAANPMFEKIAKKTGGYEGKFDEKTHTVTVTILNKDAKLTEMSGSGLIAGLTKLYKENHLTKIKISDNSVIDLDNVWKYAKSQLSAEDQNNEEKIKAGFMGNLKLLIGTHVGSTLKDGKALDLNKDTLGLFIGKEVNLELTIEQPGCEKPTSITYKVRGIAKNGTTVDDSNVKPVDPNGDKEGTGIIVTNPDDDTKVTAKDEGDNDLRAEINPDTGEIEVTPVPDGEGSITVTVEDPDLPGGKTEIIVPRLETSAEPTITQPKAGDTSVSGTGVPGATVVLKDNDGSKIGEATVDEDGNWTVDDIPADKLVKGEKVTAEQTEPGKKPAKADETVSAKAQEETSAKPTITAPKAGATSVSGTGVPGATIVLKDKDGNKIGDATVDQEGNWTVENIPANKLVEGEKVTAEQTEPGKAPASEEAPIAAKGEETSEKPKITAPKAGDTSVSGTGKPGATIVLKDKDGNKIGKATVGEDGSWKVDNIPTDKLVQGEKVTAEQTEPGKAPAKADATVAAKAPSGDDDKDKTTVDGSNPTPVDPTDEKQGTGIVVKNPDDNTKVTAKDEDGNNVPAEINKETGEIEVTPGKNVDGPITVTVEDSDLPGGKTEVEVKVNGHEKGRDDNKDGKPAKSNDGPSAPSITWRGLWFLGGKTEPAQTSKEMETGRHYKYLYGYVDKTVRPEGMITRSEAAALIARLANLDMSDKTKPNFKDTPSAWYNSAINAMVSRNLMFADKNGNFRPNEPITRGEFARALYYIDKKNDKVAPFADVKGHEFEEAINQAYGNGRIAGYPDGTFKPDAKIQRAEAARILNQYADRNVNLVGMANVKRDLVRFTDINESHWAYCEVMEAANSHEYQREKGTLAETWLRILDK